MTDLSARRVLTGATRWLVRLVLLAFALLVAAAIVVVVVLPRASNGAALTVLTGSMTPEIPVGSVVLVRPVDPGTLEVGDVATYQVSPDREVFITHRVVEVLDGGENLRFVFQGDANRGPDVDPIPAGAVRGEVWFHVPYLGAIRDGLHGRGGITLVAMILLAGYALTQVSAGLRERRRTGAGSTATEQPALTIDRPLLRVTLPRRAGEEPVDVVRGWGGLLLDVDDATYTFLVAPPDGGIEAALELLQAQEPVVLEVWDGPVSLVGTRAEVPRPRREVARASDQA